jgi:hypothetical protein
MSLSNEEQLDILEQRLEGLSSTLQSEVWWAGRIQLQEDMDMLKTEISKLSERIEIEAEILQKIKDALGGTIKIKI